MNDGSHPAGRRTFGHPGVDEDGAQPMPQRSISLSFSHPPIEFVCPVSKATMTDPFISLNTGISYERTAINAWQSVRGSICPVTGNDLGLLVPNKELKAQIEEWKQQIKGFRRIQRGSPTTYCLADTATGTTSSRSDRKQQHRQETNESQERKEAMYRRIEQLLETFSEAGFSDYRDRYQNENTMGRGPSTSSNIQERLAESMPTYAYDLEYSSIFRRGPTISTSSTISRSL